MIAALLYLLLVAGLQAAPVTVDGSTRDLAAAAQAVRDTAAGRLTVPSNVYHVYAPIDLSDLGPLIVAGDGESSLIWLHGRQATLRLDGTTPRLRDLRIHGDPNDPPEIGVTFARNGEGPRKGWSLGVNGLENVRIDGAFSKAACYLLSAEITHIRDSMISNSLGHALVDATDDFLETGRHTDSPLFTGSVLLIEGSSLSAYGGKQSFPLVLSGSVDHVTVVGSYFAVNQSTAYIWMRAYPQANGRRNRPTANVLLTGMFEGAADYGVLYTAVSGASFPEFLRTPVTPIDGWTQAASATWWELDAAALLRCYSGPGVPALYTCAACDLDQDGDVDQADFGLWQARP